MTASEAEAGVEPGHPVDPDLVVAVDCSTTAAKAVVADAAGRALAAASRPLTTSNPQAGFHEQDARQWADATVDAVAKAIARLRDAEGPGAPARVGAVALTHQREIGRAHV